MIHVQAIVSVSALLAVLGICISFAFDCVFALIGSLSPVDVVVRNGLWLGAGGAMILVIQGLLA